MWRRIFLISLYILFGLLIAEGIESLFTPPINRWFSFLLKVFLSICAVAFLLLSETFPRKKDEPGPVSTAGMLASGHLESDLKQLNLELEKRSNLHQNELARLNVELSLQMAKHQQAEVAARQNEERFRNLADNIQEGLTIIENGRQVYVNQRACEIFGECPEGDLAQRFRDFALPAEAGRVKEILAGDFPAEFQYWIRRRDGGTRCIREHYSTLHSEDSDRLFIVTSDVTDRLQALQTLEHAVEDRTRELSTVLDVSQRIASTLELEPLLYLILDQIASIIPFSGAAIYTLEENKLTVAAFQLPGLHSLPPSLALPLEHAGPFGNVITGKQVVILDDVEESPPLSRAYQEMGIQPDPIVFRHSHSWIGIPLVVRDRVTGLLSLTHDQPGYYTHTHARLAQAITNQVAVAIENARLYEQAQDLATLEERNRIARELHDSVTQLLYGISLYSTAASRSIRKKNLEQVENTLVEIKDNSLQALQEMRLLILELNPPLLQKHGLVAALKSSLESIESRAGLETELKTEGVTRLPGAIEPDLYRIAMEALNNLVRYARARKVSVELQLRSNWVILDISDNGVGFKLEDARISGGMGIQNMEQRARRLGGRLEITSNPGRGTNIKAEIPLLGHDSETQYIPAGVNHE